MAVTTRPARGTLCNWPPTPMTVARRGGRGLGCTVNRTPGGKAAVSTAVMLSPIQNIAGMGKRPTGLEWVPRRVVSSAAQKDRATTLGPSATKTLSSRGARGLHSDAGSVGNEDCFPLDGARGLHCRARSYRPGAEPTKQRSTARSESRRENSEESFMAATSQLAQGS